MQPNGFLQFCGWLSVLLLLFTGAVRGQSAVWSFEPIARFEEAADLAVDQQGTVYVVDAAAAEVTRIRGKRIEKQALSAGQNQGHLSEPVAIEPTNGLRLVIADAGLQAVQWYSRSFQLLTSQTLGTNDRQQDFFEQPEGRPVAVAAAATGTLFIVDGAQNVVLIWNRSQRLERIVGRAGTGAGRLVNPVDLVTAGEKYLLVADRAQEKVLVYDLYGNYIRSIAHGKASNLQALSVSNNQLLVVLPKRVLVYDLRGRLVKTFRPELEESLVDCVRTENGYYLLTRTQLVHLPTNSNP